MSAMMREVLTCPLAWSMVLGGIGLWLLLPSAVKRWRRASGWLLVAASVGLLFAYLPQLGDWFAQGLFWALAGMTLISAVATITMRAPVYSAVWFSVTLLMTAGLFLMQQAQFLAIATIAVYAGAILVMFLFVLMLAQPEGHTFYDRITWGPLAPAFAVLAAVLIVGGMTYEVVHVDKEQLAVESDAARFAADKEQEEQLEQETSDWRGLTREELLKKRREYWNGLSSKDKEEYRKQATQPGVSNSDAHMAGLGGELFGPQLIAVEVAGTLLLVALVGALAIVIHGRDPRSPRTSSQGAMAHE